MEYALEERIGKPELFVGRKKELNYFLKWIDGIKDKKSKSTAILARRKMGKTALIERLYNITFDKNDGVIPFYYEVKEEKKWIVDFCQDFFLTFIYQYIAFKSRKAQYLDSEDWSNFDKVVNIARKEGLDYLTGFIEGVAHAIEQEKVGILWDMVREAPKKIAARQGEFIVQMIDEFQFLNDKIYHDKDYKNLAEDLAAGYLSTAESKVAPLLVTGSWVGWLMNLLTMMLPARFKYKYLENMPEDETIEMIFKYSQFFDVPVTEETAYLISEFSEGSPFYISAILRSEIEDKDLETVDGLAKNLEFETLDDRAEIKRTWMEYVAKAFGQVNEKNAKSIVLYLCKNRDREVTRSELLEKLSLNMTDSELELKLKALVNADIIQQGQSNFRYQAVKDNIFDKVFRGVYQEEIECFEPGVIKKEYLEAFETLKKDYNSLQGRFNYYKGYFAEYMIIDQLRIHARKNNAFLKSITRNLPQDFDFCEYESVWKYNAAVNYSQCFNVDIFARAKPQGNYSIIGEVKNRDVKKFSKEEAEAFLNKLDCIKESEKVSPAIGYIFSRMGFTKEAEEFLNANGIAYSDDEQWLGKKE